MAVMTRRVAYFVDSVSVGGTEQVLLSTIESLDRQGWEPILIYHPEPGLEPLLGRPRELGVGLYPIPRMRAGLAVTRIPDLAYTLYTQKPDVFHAHLNRPLACTHGLLAAKIACVPAIVATTHLYVDRPWTKLERSRQRLVTGAVDCYVAVSSETACRYRQAFGIPDTKLRVIRNGISLAPWEGRPEPSGRTSLVGSESGPLILTVGRLDAQKGQTYLLQAARLVPNAVFVLAGDGPDRRGLESEARRLGIADRVIFLGFRDDLPSLFVLSDVVVLPSLFEGLPLSVLEAMAAARPVVATDVGGVGEAVVAGVTGLLVPPADPEALATAIRQLLENRTLAAELGAAGQERVRRDFSIETMVGRTMALYDELLEIRRH